MIDRTTKGQKVIAREEAKRRLLRRKSFECPVYLKLKETLDSEEFLDIEHCLDVMLIAVKGMPEAAATVELLRGLKCCNSG